MPSGVHCGAQLLLGAEVNFLWFVPSTSVTQTSRKGLLLFDFKDGGTVYAEYLDANDADANTAQKRSITAKVDATTPTVEINSPAHSSENQTRTPTFSLTATEAASLGVVGALILSFFKKSLNKETFKLSLLGATKTSCMIAFILAGSSFLSLAMGFTGLPRGLAIWIQEMDLSPYVLILVLTIFYIILGMFLDGISAVVLTMAIIEPMIRQAGFDMIWFGVFLVIVVEMAQITPPVGFNLFVLQGMANKDMGFIAKSAFPLFLLMILAVVVIIIFPDIALWLPEQMIQSLK